MHFLLDRRLNIEVAVHALALNVNRRRHAMGLRIVDVDFFGHIVRGFHVDFQNLTPFQHQATRGSASFGLLACLLDRHLALHMVLRLERRGTTGRARIDQVCRLLSGGKQALAVVLSM
mgnify:CR=1 FL=1